jgi:hypothetical protein
MISFSVFHRNLLPSNLRSLRVINGTCSIHVDRLYGLQVRVPGYRSRAPGFDSRVWNGVYSASWRKLRSYLKGKVAASVRKTEIKGRGDSLRWPRDTLYPLKLALTSSTSGGRSVGIVRWRTKAPEFVLSLHVRRSLPPSSFLATSATCVSVIFPLLFVQHNHTIFAFCL